MGRAYSNTPPGTAPLGSISNAELADMAAGTTKGRALGGGTGAPQDLTALQELAIVQSAGAVIDDGNSGAAKTIDFSAGPNHKLTLTAACALTFTAPQTGAVVSLRIVQDATGNFAATFPGSVVGVPAYFRSATDSTLLQFLYDGTSYVLQTDSLHKSTAITWQPQGSFPTNGQIKRIELIDHFLNVGDSHIGLVATVSGAGAQVISGGTPGAGRVGTAFAETGTTTTGRAALSTAPGSIEFSAATNRHRLRSDFSVANASDGTDTFTVRFGFLDSDSAEPTDGCYFRYTHSVNSGEWQAVTRTGAAETANDTNVTLSAGTIRVFEIEVTANTSVKFYIDGLLVATNTTNIPSAAGTGFGFHIIKSAGTTSRSMRSDLVAYSCEFQTAL